MPATYAEAPKGKGGIPAAVLRALKPGSIVKVSDGRQRFWAAVAAVVPAASPLDLRITAVVDSDLLDGPEPGDEIHFLGRNVLEVYKEAARPTKPKAAAVKARKPMKAMG